MEHRAQICKHTIPSLRSIVYSHTIHSTHFLLSDDNFFFVNSFRLSFVWLHFRKFRFVLIYLYTQLRHAMARFLKCRHTHRYYFVILVIFNNAVMTDYYSSDNYRVCIIKVFSRILSWLGTVSTTSTSTSPNSCIAFYLISTMRKFQLDYK